jgi:hypothetical protein
MAFSASDHSGKLFNFSWISVLLNAAMVAPFMAS